MSNHTSESAYDDFMAFILEAKPSIRTLEELKDSIRLGGVDKGMYWNEDTNCGCVKGLLFVHEFQMTPEEAYDDLDEDIEGDVLEKVEQNPYGPIEGIISHMFNDAPVSFKTPFERWLLDEYVDESEEHFMLLEWIDDAIKMLKEKD